MPENKVVDPKVSKYVDAITREAKEASDNALKQIEDYKRARIDSFSKAANEEAELEFKRRSAAIHEDIGRDFSEKEIVLRSALFRKRDEIKSFVFEQAYSELLKFSKSPEYEAFLVKSVESIKRNLVGRDKVVTVFLRPDDIAHRELIEKTMVYPCDFKEDKSILYGGIRIKFAHIVIDDTLDSRLVQLSAWFEENSGLEIK